MLTFSRQPEGDRRLGDFLRRNLATAKWTEFRAAVAFVKRSGMQHIRAALFEISKRGTVRIAVGVDLKGTSIEGLTELLEAVGKTGEVWVFHNENWSTFHPKIYIFASETKKWKSMWGRKISPKEAYSPTTKRVFRLGSTYGQDSAGSLRRRLSLSSGLVVGR